MTHTPHTHSVGLHWTSDQPVAEATTTKIHNSQSSAHPAEFEPAIPASERPQNRALDRAAN